MVHAVFGFRRARRECETRYRPFILHDGPARPAAVRIRAPGVVELALSEGRHHQVKRMLAAVGLPVQGLHREAVGGVVLDVPEGSLRRHA